MKRHKTMSQIKEKEKSVTWKMEEWKLTNQTNKKN